MVGLITTLVITALGAPLGFLWRAVAPSVPVVRTEHGSALTDPQPEQFAAADGWFALLGFGFGVLVAVLGWIALRRYRGPVGLLAVVWGGIGASLVAWAIARWVGHDEYQRLLATAAVGEVIHRPPELRAGRLEWIYGVIPTLQGSLLIPAFAAAMAYTLLAGWSRYATLGVEPEAACGPDGAGPVSADGTGSASSDSPAPQAPPGAPAPPARGAAASPPE